MLNLSRALLLAVMGSRRRAQALRDHLGGIHPQLVDKAVDYLGAAWGQPGGNRPRWPRRSPRSPPRGPGFLWRTGGQTGDDVGVTGG